MSELTPEARVWVAPDAYDNPTLWTDGPTPDFPRALLVRVSSNADLFDWIVGSVDALAAEKAAREEAERTAKQAVVLQRMAEDEAEAAERAATAQSQHCAKQYQRAEAEKARANKAEQERRAAMYARDEAVSSSQKHCSNSLRLRRELRAAEARVAELEAGIEALINEWGHEPSCHECDDFCCKTQRLSALLTEKTDPTKGASRG